MGCFTTYQPFSGHLTPDYIILIKIETIQFSISTVFCLHTVKYQNSCNSNNLV